MSQETRKALVDWAFIAALGVAFLVVSIVVNR